MLRTREGRGFSDDVVSPLVEDVGMVVVELVNATDELGFRNAETVLLAEELFPRQHSLSATLPGPPTSSRTQV